MGALLRFGGVIVSRVFHIVHGCIRVGLGDLAGGVIFFGFYCGQVRGGGSGQAAGSRLSVG